ncbi:DUF4020 domain-containing protein [Modestobacter sp. VKM Ac-2978]|uniref:DUF4020 domain-containing protein n=1 Tax=Modestobacter sp. VKM Ac-2978 TaxID=3004132 RepID=UPI0022AA461A|nr:DUF4020 domain-containing protein [Modestobacter sp. VKM Ac-2978]MCZ2849811.1 DUF4020 domain-containing protein [Modestobacter sp. VKM Ac-2978]
MWISDVNVPTELIDAARAGRLVIFVGAGASVDPPANLPNFRSLVREVGARAGTPPTETDLERLDRFLGNLDDRGIQVHDLVAKAIDQPDSRPNRLHRAIIDLARARPPVRIVTTNYDRHLTSAAEAAGLDVEVFRAPALPVGDDFVGIVHLHGALGQDTRHLIVTDTDFGNAYLRQAWAARFLDRMFSAFTVLFIGYSYGDVVMQYLGRSLGREGARFVLTHLEDLPEWKTYGLTPLAYAAPENSHVALSETLERWAQLATLGRTEHRRLIADLVSTGQPASLGDEPPDANNEGSASPERVLTPEESSYLEESLGDPERVQYFVEMARGPEWLSWVATRPEFGRLFVKTEGTDEPNQAVTQALTSWVADHFVTVEESSPAALRIMRDREWSRATQANITHRLFAQDGVMPAWQTPWLLLVLQQAPVSRNGLLDMLLAKESWRERPDVALLLLQHRTRPILTSGFDLGNAAAPSFDIDLVGEEYWLTSAWTEVFLPILDAHAHALLTLVSGHIRLAYQMRRSMRPDARTDTLSFGRSAIEPHEQDDIRDSMDLLVDAARDCVERLLLNDPPAAVAQLDVWIEANEALFRRLAVHGWRVRDDRHQDEKVRWVCQHNLLYDLDTQHEVFLLLEKVVPGAASDAVEDLLDAVMAGPPPVNDEEPSPYRRYNLLAWLARTAPEVPAIMEAFTQAQAEHPQYRPREHPDLGMVMTGGVVEDAEPFTADELHTRIESDEEATLEEIRTFQAVNNFQTTGPTWRGAVNSVRALATKYPADGLLLARHFGAEDRDLRWAVIDAWADAELDDNQIAGVIEMIGAWEVDTVRGHAARMLANGGRDGRPTAWHRYESARELAASLWPTETVIGNIVESDDLILEAMNHPAGDLAQFWTKVVQLEWRSAPDDWSGLPADLIGHLDLMVEAQGRNGLLARTILGSNLRFYFAADPQWTRIRLLPLFDWDTHPTDAPAVWQGFLAQGRPDDGLLEAGLLNLYLQSCRHTDELGRERSRTQLADHLALVAMFTSTAPGSWLPALIATAPVELREAWASRVAARLSDLDSEETDQQWTRWLREYWTGRVESIPLPLTVEEASEMAQWVLALPKQRVEAVDLVKRSGARFTQANFLLHRLADEDLAADAATWTDFVTHLLRGTPQPSWDINYYLPKIANALKQAEPPQDFSALIEEAMRLGCTDAPDW